METRVHVSLEVSDLKKSIEFYGALFKMEPSKLKPDYANFRMENPNLHLALVLRPGKEPEPTTGPGSNRHFGIELFSEEKLESWFHSAQNSGLNIRTEENVTCCYATGNKFWARDPDGHHWEFWIKHDDADEMTQGQAKSQQQPACCAPGSCC